MAIGAVRFAGKDLYKPQAAVDRKFEPFAAGGASAARCIIIGESTKGIPYNASDKTVQERINNISNLDEAKQQLGSGVGYDAVKFALDPAPDRVGASEIQFIRVNPATRSTLTIVDTESSNLIDLTTTEYGLVSEQVNFKVENGTNEGRKITVRFEDDTIVGDDINLQAFSVQYTGDASTASMTLDPAGDLMIVLSGNQTDGTVNLTATIATYSTLSSLVSYIDAQAGYTATLLADGTTASNQLDKILTGEVNNLDLKTTAYTVMAELKACIDWINNSSDHLTAALASGAVRRKIHATNYATNWTYMGGGVNGSVTNTQWTESITHGQLFDASFRYVATGTAAVHSSLVASINTLSGVGGRNECQGFVGANDTDTKTVRIAAAKALGNSGVDYVGDSIYRYNDNGVLTKYDGFYTAAAFMGLKAGGEVTMPATYKRLKAIKLELTHSATDIRDYIQAGVIILEEAPEGGFRVIRGVTTSTTNNLAEVEDSMQRTARVVSKNMRQALESIFIGQPGDTLTIKSIESHAKVLLDDYADKFNYFVVDPAFGNAWRNFQLVVEGDTFRIQFEATLVAPINFILITQNFTVVGATR
jgi:hypothetical protein